jgi:D-alanine-D-alanine ligase
MEKINVAILFGGDSDESKVSKITGKQIFKAIDKDKYNVYPIFIDKELNWFLMNFKTEKMEQIFLERNKNLFYFKNRLKSKIKIHCAINAVHGGIGENGTLYTTLKQHKIFCSSSSLVPSVLTLEKNLTKLILEKHNFNLLPYIVIKKDYLHKSKEIITNFVSTTHFPIVVKPNNSGSSLGVSFAKNINELENAINIAFNFSDFIILEKGIKKVKEFNCSAFKFKQEILTSEIEKPLHKGNILTYQDKYGDKFLNKLSSNNDDKERENNTKEFPAKIDRKLKENIQTLTKKAYSIFNLSGIVRCDFIYYNKRLYLNEINSVPGSLSSYLWKNSGFTFTTLLDSIISETIHNTSI